MKKFLFFICFSLSAQTDLPGPVRSLSNYINAQPIASWNVGQTFYSGFVDGGSTGHNNIWTLPTASSAGCFGDNGSYVITIVACSGSAAAAGLDKQVQVNKTGAFYADANFTYDYTLQKVTVTGLTGTASIAAVTSFMQSDQGFLSQANNWQAFNSLTDGALLRGYHLDHPDPTSGSPQYTGGYLDIAMITYIPNGGAAYPPHDPRNCYDQYANLVSQPIPLNGLSSFGSGDVLLWNSPSPLQGYLGGSPYHIDGTPCTAPIPLPVYNSISNNTGLNTNAYILAMGGFATPINSANAVQIWMGGTTAVEYFAGGFYPAGTVTTTGTLTNATYLGGFMYMGHATQVPGNGSLCTSIASCTNPLLPGLGLLQGQFFWNDTLTLPQVYDGTNWDSYALQGGNVTFSEVTTTNTTGGCVNYQIASFEFQVDCHGNISTTGASSGHGIITLNGAFAGVNVVNDTAINSIQTVGGFQSQNGGGNNCGIVYRDSVEILQGCVAADVLVAMGQNGSGGIVRVSNGTGSGGLDSAGAQILLTASTGSVQAIGAFNSSATGSSIGFQLANSNFSINGNGVGTFVGVVNSTGASGGFDASGSTASNAVQAPSGGASFGLGVTVGQALYPLGASACSSLNTPASSYGGFGYNTGSLYCYWNGSSWASFDFSASATNYWTLSGSNLYNNSGSYVIAGTTADDGSHASLQSHSSLSVTGTIQAIGSGSAITFQNQNSTFQVDNTGVGSFASVVHASGSGGNNYFVAPTAIGTTSASYQLDVHAGNVSQIHVNGNSSGAGGFIYASNGDNNINMSGGHHWNGSGWVSDASSSGMISATGAGVFAYQNPSQSVGVGISPNLVAGFTTTQDSLYAKTVISNGAGASQINFNSVNPSTDSGGFLTSIGDNSAFLSAGAEYSGGWIARTASGAVAMTLAGGSGVNVEINNSTCNGCGYTPTLTASFRATSFNFTGHINGSLGIVSPTVSGSASCTLGSGSTDARGSIVFNSTGVCNLNFAASYSTAPVCVGTPANINGTTYLFFGATTTQWSISSNGTTTIYYICMQ